MIYPLLVTGLVFRLLGNRAKKRLARLRATKTQPTTVTGAVPTTGHWAFPKVSEKQHG